MASAPKLPHKVAHLILRLGAEAQPAGLQRVCHAQTVRSMEGAAASAQVLRGMIPLGAGTEPVWAEIGFDQGFHHL